MSMRGRMPVIYLKIGLLTCAFYLAVLFGFELVKAVVVHWQGSWGLSYASQRIWLTSDTIFYGLIWLGCFRIARHLVWRTLPFPQLNGGLPFGA
jgi:hypothetical protein